MCISEGNDSSNEVNDRFIVESGEEVGTKHHGLVNLLYSYAK